MVQAASGGPTGPESRPAASAGSKAMSDSRDAPSTSSSSDSVKPSTAALRPRARSRPLASGGGGGGVPKAGTPSSGLDWHRVFLGVLFTLLWMFFSSALIIMNRHLYKIGFAHPCFVTGVGQIVSAIGGYVYVKVRGSRLWPLRMSL